uniref:unspecific monooxygenase n=1 Tax=Epiphyas postvittana TaxID=65032 RepID=A0A0K8TV67_EPIPO
MAYIYVLVALATIAYSLYYYFNRTFNYWKDRNVAGPKPVTFFGNISDAALRKTPMMIVLKKLYDEYPNEKVVGVYRMTTPNLLIRDPDLVKQVMIKDFDMFADRGVEFSKQGLGANLFHADGETWRVLRNRFTPIFTSGKLRNMLYLITDRADNFIQYVEQITQKNPEQEVYSLVQKYTMSTISACAFGLDIDTTKESDMMETLTRIDQKIFTTNFSHELDMMYPGILKKFSGSVFPAEVKSFFFGLVEQVMTARKGMPSHRKDFMDLILELRQQKEVVGTKRTEDDKERTLELTESVIAAQAFVFYAAGYETTASTMGYMLYQLALNPDVQDKAVAEINEVLKRHDGKLTYDAIKEMPYMDNVFDETLRMYPIVDPLQRNVQADYKIPGSDITLKKGQTILLSVNGIHNDPKYWPNPSKFDPDRFTPENEANRHSAVYLPFGLGPRNCIGMRFAKVQSRVCVVKLLQKFRLEPTAHTLRNFVYNPKRLVLSPLGGFKMNLVPRV